MEKKRILVVLVILFSLIIFLNENASAQCTVGGCGGGCAGECTSGTSEFGGVCSACGMTMRRDCDSGGAWGGWYCQPYKSIPILVSQRFYDLPPLGDVSNSVLTSNEQARLLYLRNSVIGDNYDSLDSKEYPSWAEYESLAIKQQSTYGQYGQSCGLCGGTIKCDGTCSIPTPSNYGQPCGNQGTIQCDGTCSRPCDSRQGQACGNCGTYDCLGNCINQGLCFVGQTQNLGNCGNCGILQQTCQGNCQYAPAQCINQGPCSAGQTSCSGDTTQVCGSNCQWQTGQNCNTQDGWYGGGNTQTATCGSVDNDATSEFRNYGCSGGSCTYSVTQTADCDGSDGWYGGGNSAGCGSDPNSVWNDYYVTTNTGSCTSTTTCSGTGSANCDSNDVCNNKCEGTVFTSVPPMKDYYVVSNSNSCTSTTDTPSTENCATKASTDSDNSPVAYTVPGSVTDYSACTLGGCTGTAYSDSCSGTILTEYGASGSSFTSSAYECQNFESNYCSGDRYYRNEWACTSSPGACTDAADTQIGTNADGDLKDKECGDSLCDNAPNVYDSTKTATETSCADGLDNDCDGQVDCNDPDCNGSVAGTVKNADNQSVSSASVSAKKGFTTVATSTTSQQGSYSIASLSCDSYDLVASHQDYAPRTQAFSLAPNQQLTINFDGGNALVFGTSCEQDCTFAADNIIHASCDGKNGCAFYDSIAKAACDNSQPGWARDYNSSHYINCASGSPQPKIEIEASVSCASPRQKSMPT